MPSIFATKHLALFVFISIADPSSAHYDDAYFRNANDGFLVRNSWMEELSDDLQLSELALPGTHDSAAFQEQGTLVDTQCLNINDQLKVGIRFFDIRVRHYGDKLELHHGQYYLNQNFDEFLSTVRQFLMSFKTETVLFRVSREGVVGAYTAGGNYNKKTITEVILGYLNKYSDTWMQGVDISVKLGEARGKFIPLFDNEFGLPGIKYRSLKIQDNYEWKVKTDLYSKWLKVKSHLEMAKSGSKNTFYANYLSASGSLTDMVTNGVVPYFFASGREDKDTNSKQIECERSDEYLEFHDFPSKIERKWGNGWTITHITICEGTNIMARNRINSYNQGTTAAEKGTRTVGIIIADFPGNSLITAIIENNFRNTPVNRRPLFRGGIAEILIPTVIPTVIPTSSMKTDLRL